MSVNNSISKTYPLDSAGFQTFHFNEVGDQLRSSDYNVDKLAGREPFNGAHSCVIGKKRDNGKVVGKFTYFAEKIDHALRLIHLRLI